MLIDKAIYDSVEKVLKRYPKSWSKNYYQNKEDLIVVQKDLEMKSRFAGYSNEDNKIIIYGDNFGSLPHELFHMTFRDRDKVGIEIVPGYLYSNGICYTPVDKDRKDLMGLLEGFTEYLARFCNGSRGYEVEFFVVDLLISIYGEDILEYCFNNDPMGFLEDKRFYDITDLAANLDILNDVTEEISLTLYFKKTLERLMKEDEVAHKEILKMLNQKKKLFNKSVIDSVDSLINEYRACANPKINKDAFIYKMSMIFTDPSYKAVFCFKNNEYNVGKSLQKSIDEFKRH